MGEKDGKVTKRGVINVGRLGGGKDVQFVKAATDEL